MSFQNSENDSSSLVVQFNEVVSTSPSSEKSADIGNVAGHSRRSHRKSRYGCRNCKNRRIKCDETKPECTRCLKHGIQCDYVHFQPKPQSKTKSVDLIKIRKGVAPDMAANTMSLVAVDRSICEAACFDDYGNNTLQLCSLDSSQLTNMEILHNFVTDFTDAILDTRIQTVLRTSLVQVAFSNAHLMHTILAVSCLFLNRVRPENKEREILEMYHWQRAIRLYQAELSSAKIGRHNTDALIGSCVLMGMNNLCPVGLKPEHSWVFTSNASDLNWLALQGGLRCLMDVTKPFIDDGIWGPAFQSARDSLWSFFEEQTGRQGLDDALADLCEIDEHTTTATNPYFWPVQVLSRMMKLKPYNRKENYSVFVTFMGRISPDFIAYLRQKDERALVVLSWWMALMCAVEPFQPWIGSRIVQECQAICMYLESTSTDPQILNLTKWPAAACGYHEVPQGTFNGLGEPIQ